MSLLIIPISQQPNHPPNVSETCEIPGVSSGSSQPCSKVHYTGAALCGAMALPATLSWSPMGCAVSLEKQVRLQRLHTALWHLFDIWVPHHCQNVLSREGCHGQSDLCLRRKRKRTEASSKKPKGMTSHEPETTQRPEISWQRAMKR